MQSSRCWFLGWVLALGFVPSMGAWSAPPSDVRVTDAWIRWLPANVPSAGYMTLVNTGTVDEALVAVSSDAYGEVSIHQSLDDQGMSRMRPVDAVALPSKQSVRFEQGGYHLMLMRPRRPIGPGDTVVMTMHFKNAPALDVAFKVRAAA